MRAGGAEQRDFIGRVVEEDYRAAATGLHAEACADQIIGRQRIAGAGNILDRIDVDVGRTRHLAH